MIAIPAGFNPQDYLALEKQASVRHEYRQGLVYAMAGGSDDHSRITINLLTALNLHLRDGHCQFYSGDVKVSYANHFFYYPDAFVTCDPRDLEDRFVKRYPKFIAEVLSPSTERFDQDDKFKDYQKIQSLQDYVLVAQDKMLVEYRHRPTPLEVWQTTLYTGGDCVVFPSIDLSLPIEDLYRGIRFASSV